jgi:hypothetical protein
MFNPVNYMQRLDTDNDMRWFAENPGRNMRIRQAEPSKVERFSSHLRGAYPATAHFFVIIWRSYTPDGVLVPGCLNAFLHAFDGLPPGVDPGQMMPDWDDGEIASMLMGILRDFGMPPVTDAQLKRFRRGFQAA